ncbi:PLP-dependent cysteine synthase family protein [Vibrio tubiashii]|uniref:cysteine synthase n=1 Tax=Vibrio tubiashii TaxID=29498 RepID=A0AAE5GQ45_9VIBR|nr:PLP-dependent cysteine synthase family protein [Vibrio tubiashii]NOI81061.1 PLP-dependent cysteine synthase family protein [Vibrio tubiashii]
MTSKATPNPSSTTPPTRTCLAPSVSEAIGLVPYVRLNRIHPLCRSNHVYVKLESCSPTGSIKDKNAAYLIRLAEEQGKLKPGSTIIESSSGNFGLALASVGASRGYRVVVVIDAKTPPPIIKMLRAYGAHLEEVPLSLADEAGSMQKARMAHAQSLANQTPNAFYPCQHLNPDNPLAHAHHTAVEIAEAFDPFPDAIVIGVSTAGQLSGIARYFRIHSPSTEIIAVDVAGSGIFGQPRHPYKMTGIGLSFPPPALKRCEFDYAYNVSDVLSFSMCHHLAQKEGLLLGASSGAILCATLAYAHQRHAQGKSIVVINPDRGDRYMDTVYNPEWLSDNGLTQLSIEQVQHQVTHLTPVLSPMSQKSAGQNALSSPL